MNEMYNNGVSVKCVATHVWALPTLEGWGGKDLCLDIWWPCGSSDHECFTQGGALAGPQRASVPELLCT